ncbi:DUF2894 domain-containing protein [Pseudoxanthomonas wuyuanensis]|nr:DUF2894 domain-containing protein [Pseudoxanthomonas wuyuanensis]KAF1720276.1 DUF2894 domain-containing protein [Pseudoxanthomonas wuyuanensis]
MRGKQMPGHAVLAAWREQGADRMDPVAFHYMEALHRRANDHGGQTRRALEGKLSGLIQDYAGALERTAFKAPDRGRRTAPARGALGALVDGLASRAAARDGGAADSGASGSAFPQLDALHDFRKIWASVRTASQVRRSLEPSPMTAGPLNSGSLVHRSLTLMRELSPGYLQQFLAYVDALSWLQQMNGSGGLAARDASPRDGGKPRTRPRPRKRSQ